MGLVGLFLIVARRVLQPRRPFGSSVGILRLKYLDTTSLRVQSRQAPHCPANRKANVQGGDHCAVVAVTAPMRWLHQWVVGAAAAAAAAAVVVVLVVVVVVALVAVAVSTTPEVGAGGGQEKAASVETDLALAAASVAAAAPPAPVSI